MKSSVERWKGTAFARFIPSAIAVLVVLGNFSPALPIWGFNYYVLHLPFGSTSEWISNFFILLIGIYPLISLPKEVRWYHTTYAALGLFALAVMAIEISLMWYFPWPSTADSEASSIFSGTSSQLMTCVLVAIYLAYSLSGYFVSRRELVWVLVSIGISTALAGARIHEALGYRD